MQDRPWLAFCALNLLAQAYLKHGYTLSEIGRAVGLHYAAISRIIAASETTS